MFIYFGFHYHIELMYHQNCSIPCSLTFHRALAGLSNSYIMFLTFDPVNAAMYDKSTWVQLIENRHQSFHHHTLILVEAFVFPTATSFCFY